MEIGSPKDDAQRRDFTVNSLFYNLSSNQVEDWTGKGLQDLHAGIIRTPLEPRVTLLEGVCQGLHTSVYQSTICTVSTTIKCLNKPVLVGVQMQYVHQ
jgi:tRNA nucleotidyltransferase (CCA-adding enzyme)